VPGPLQGSWHIWEPTVRAFPKVTLLEQGCGRNPRRKRRGSLRSPVQLRLFDLGGTDQFPKQLE